ncbi:MAG: hypothetical protein JNK21_09295, partial [Rhodospirillaceae bacterium]|nr:hypothetical protein [Rhodospirillaceae bacterium]
MTLSISRRGLCVSAAAVSVSAASAAWILPAGPVGAARRHNSLALTADALDLRGVRPGGHATLRSSGFVMAETQPDVRWPVRETTVLSWRAAPDGLLEQRHRRIQIEASGIEASGIKAGGKIIEHILIETELLAAPLAHQAFAQTSGLSSLAQASRAFNADEAWAVLDDPARVELPADMAEVHVFRSGALKPLNLRTVHHLARMTGIPGLGLSQTEPVIWRTSGLITGWAAMPEVAAVQ